ncbi:cilia- and flagella-associated protein 45 isoform X3 [Columba livia]|uniref:cilia- and flagella-associated protein 45 isoform X3 n=1 Tax=Columba livia TaxID=8932 RepID=UPI0031BB2430
MPASIPPSPSRAPGRQRISGTADETLLGESRSPMPSRSGSPIVILRDARTAPKASHKPETIRLITKDFVRDVVVPVENPPASLVMGREDFQRIQAAARVLSKQEREARLAALKAEKEAALDALHERMRAEKEKAARQQAGKLSDLEEEAKERMQHLRQRASRMRMEQEDEIKEFSEMVLGAKCHMIRDMQILEKRLITKELEEEEKRLDKMMEVERTKANEMQEELERRRKEEMIRGRQEIVKQMEKNAEERALRAEQQDQEVQEMLKYLERLKMEDLKEMERKREEQNRIQAEIRRVNDENQRRKEEQRERERMEDERVLEYQRQKMEREAELEAEQERIRQEKEKETARLRAMQERAQDHKAEQDALRAKRSQEAAEREWRRKEKEAAQRRAETNRLLKQSRMEQIAQREHSMAVQVQQDRDEFERILRCGSGSSSWRGSGRPPSRRAGGCRRRLGSAASASPSSSSRRYRSSEPAASPRSTVPSWSGGRWRKRAQPPTRLSPRRTRAPVPSRLKTFDFLRLSFLRTEMFYGSDSGFRPSLPWGVWARSLGLE